MVYQIQLTVPFAAPVPLSWSDNQNHQTEKPENVLHRCGRLCFQNYEKFSLVTTPKAITLFPPLLAPVGHEQLYNVIAPILCEHHISDVVLQQIANEASTLAQDRTAHV